MSRLSKLCYTREHIASYYKAIANTKPVSLKISKLPTVTGALNKIICACLDKRHFDSSFDMLYQHPSILKGGKSNFISALIFVRGRGQACLQFSYNFYCNFLLLIDVNEQTS